VRISAATADGVQHGLGGPGGGVGDVASAHAQGAVAGIDLDLFGFVIVAVLILAGATSWALSRRPRRGTVLAR
jgi:hypothetical protein